MKTKKYNTLSALHSGKGLDMAVAQLLNDKHSTWVLGDVGDKAASRKLHAQTAEQL